MNAESIFLLGLAAVAIGFALFAIGFSCGCRSANKQVHLALYRVPANDEPPSKDC